MRGRPDLPLALRSGAVRRVAFPMGHSAGQTNNHEASLLALEQPPPAGGAQQGDLELILVFLQV